MKTPTLDEQTRNRAQFTKHMMPFASERKAILKKIFWLVVLLLIYAGILFA